MRKKGILIVGLALMIAAAGVVYAHWEETLTVDVSVATGNIDPVWSLTGTNDDSTNTVVATDYTRPNMVSGADPSGPGMTPTRYTKAVADCVAAGDGTDALTVTITNGYPSYWCTVAADLENTGTVPVKLQSLFLDLPSEIDVSLQGVDFLACGYQLDPGDHIDFLMSFHVNNTALESTNYTFDLDLTWYNWNEYTAGGAGCPTVITSSLMNFSSTGWGGWSVTSGCSAVLGGWLSPAVPGGTVYPYSGQVFVGPGTTPFGYTYAAGEMGFIVQNGGTPQNAYINYICIP